MSILTIDTFTNERDFSEFVPLEGREFLFRIYWADREACFYLNIADQDETPLATGIKLVVGWPLLRRFVDARLPPGLFMCVDMSGAGAEIATPLELGYRVPLLYVTSDDVSIAGRNLRMPL